MTTRHALHRAAALSFRSRADAFRHEVDTLTDADTAEMALDRANDIGVRPLSRRAA